MSRSEGNTVDNGEPIVCRPETFYTPAYWYKFSIAGTAVDM